MFHHKLSFHQPSKRTERGSWEIKEFSKLTEAFHDARHFSVTLYFFLLQSSDSKLSAWRLILKLERNPSKAALFHVFYHLRVVWKQFDLCIKPEDAQQCVHGVQECFSHTSQAFPQGQSEWVDFPLGESDGRPSFQCAFWSHLCTHSPKLYTKDITSGHSNICKNVINT